MLLGSALTQINSRSVALAGRVPVKVNTENGPISIGDRIAPSSIPGVGRKAIDPESSIGLALSGYSGEEIGRVMVFVNLQSPAPSFQFLASNLQEASGALTDTANLAVVAQWSISDDGVLVVRELRAERLCLGKVCLDEAKLKNLLERREELISTPELEGGDEQATTTPEIVEPEATTTPEVIVEEATTTAEVIEDEELITTPEVVEELKPEAEQPPVEVVDEIPEEVIENEPVVEEVRVEEPTP